MAIGPQGVPAPSQGVGEVGTGFTTTRSCPWPFHCVDICTGAPSSGRSTWGARARARDAQWNGVVTMLAPTPQSRQENARFT